MSMWRPTLSVVVSTIGRKAEFRRLLQSVSDSGVASEIELIVVDQSADQRCLAVLAEKSWNVRVIGATSGPGASVGRNVGLTRATASLVAFPDDDAWYPPDTLADVARQFVERPLVAAMCGRQLTSDGRPSMLRWQGQPSLVTPRNFMRTSIMSTMFFRRSWLNQVEGFDETMGVGSQQWYGACEESDLLLRVIEAGGRVEYEPSLVVLQNEPRDEPDDSFVRKMLAYGCGHGHLWRKRQLPIDLLGYYCARKVLAAGVRYARGQRVLARADIAWLRGNIAGFRDVPPKSLRTLALRT